MLAECVTRKVMLYQHPIAAASRSHHFEVIDYKRPRLPITVEDVVVPCHIEKDDMVWVAGDAKERWLGLVDSVDGNSRAIRLYFFRERHYQPGCYVRETLGLSARNTVHWNSVIDIAGGQWRADEWILE